MLLQSPKLYRLDDKNGVVECSAAEANALWADPRRIVDQTTLPDGRYVSTAFLMIPQDHRTDTDPLENALWFETAVIDEYGDIKPVERYKTYEEAAAGHQRHAAKQAGLSRLKGREFNPQ